MDWLSQVDGVHGNLDFTDEVVFPKAVEVKHLQHQSLTSQICVGDLKAQSQKKEKSEVGRWRKTTQSTV